MSREASPLWSTEPQIGKVKDKFRLLITAPDQIRKRGNQDQGHDAP